MVYVSEGRLTLEQNPQAIRLSAQLSRVAAQMHDSTEQLQSWILSMSKGIEEQASTFGQTLNGLAELQSLPATVNQSLVMARELTGSVTRTAAAGGERVKVATDGLSGVRESIDRAQGQVAALLQHSRAIGEVVKVVSRISDQTNLLALNAAIEAARVGQYGKGFAVVAQEIRRLADQTRKQTQEINALIGSMQGAVEQTVTVMRENADAMHRGQEMVGDLGEAFETVDQSIGDFLMGLEPILTGLESVSQQIGEVAAGATDGQKVLTGVFTLLQSTAQVIDQERGHTTLLTKMVETIPELSGAAVPAEGQSLAVHLSTEEIDSLEPAAMTEPASARVVTQIFSTLIKLGPGTELLPGLARGWEVSPDGLTWTFHLRRGVRCHDGSLLTAEDVVFSLNRLIKNLNSPSFFLVEGVAGAAECRAGRTQTCRGIRATSTQTVQIDLDAPFAPFAANLAAAAASIVPRTACSGGRFRPIGTGPFRYVRQEADGTHLLEAFAEYFEGAPCFDRLVMGPQASGEAEIAQFQRGELHLVDLPVQLLERVKADPVLRQSLVTVPRLVVAYLGFNMQSRSPVQNRLVRQAINYAIDKERLLAEWFRGQAHRLPGPIPEGVLGYDPKEPGYGFDPERSRRLLAEAGFPKGLPTPIILHCSNASAPLMGSVAEMLAQVGIRLQVKAMPLKEVKDPEQLRKCDLYYLQWVGDTTDPDNFLWPLFLSRSAGTAANNSHYQSAVVDHLLEEARRVNMASMREQIYRQAQRQIIEDAPWVFLGQPHSNWLVHPALRGFKLHPLGLHQFQGVWVNPQVSEWVG